MKNADMPVNPMFNEHGAPLHPSNAGLREGVVSGLTKRELFAAMAMQGFMSNKGHATHFLPEDDAKYCIKIADALLQQLEASA